MAANLGSMTAQATLNAKGFNSGLAKMQSDTAKTAKGVSSSVGLMFSKIGFSALGGGLSFGAITGAMRAQLEKDQTEANRMAELAGRRPSRLQTDLAKGTQFMEDAGSALVLVLANVGSAILSVVTQMRMVSPVGDLPDHAAQLASLRRQQELLRLNSQMVDQALVAGTEAVMSIERQGIASRELQSRVPGQRIEDVAAQRRATTLAGSTPIERERIALAATATHQNLVDSLNIEIRTLGMSRDQVRAFTHALGESNPARRAELALLLERRQADEEAINEGRAAMADSFALAEQAMTPLEIFERQMNRIGDAGLTAAQSGRLAAQALAQLNQSLDSVPGGIGSLAAGSREVAELMQGRRDERNDVAAITRAAMEQQARADAANLRELQELNRNLGGGWKAELDKFGAT
jgi:hypothetical protein